MGKYTRFTNLEVTDELKLGSMKASTSKVTPRRRLGTDEGGV